MSRKWRDLQERIAATPTRPHLPGQDARKPRSKRFLRPEDVANLVHRYEAGETTQQIGDRLGISKTRVATILREQGVTIRRQGLNGEQVREAATLYSAGKSLAWIGARFGVSHTTVATALRRQGFDLRARRGWR